MYKIAFLLDKKNDWIKKYFTKNQFIKTVIQRKITGYLRNHGLIYD